MPLCPGTEWYETNPPKNQDDTPRISYVEVQQSVRTRTRTHSQLCARTRTTLEPGIKVLRAVGPSSSSCTLVQGIHTRSFIGTLSRVFEAEKSSFHDERDIFHNLFPKSSLKIRKPTKNLTSPKSQ